jgi:hypothetical protein
MMGASRSCAGKLREGIPIASRIALSTAQAGGLIQKGRE